MIVDVMHVTKLLPIVGSDVIAWVHWRLEWSKRYLNGKLSRGSCRIAPS